MPNASSSPSIQQAAAYLPAGLWRCAYCGEHMKSDLVRRHHLDGLIEVRAWCQNARCQAFEVRGVLPVYALGRSVLDLLDGAPAGERLPYLVLCAFLRDFETWRSENGVVLGEAFAVNSLRALRGRNLWKYRFARAGRWWEAPPDLIKEFEQAERESSSAVTAQASCTRGI